MAGAEQVLGSDRESRPSPIDVHVGSRIRLRRTLLGMSQEHLRQIARPDIPAGAEIRTRRQPGRGVAPVRSVPRAGCTDQLFL